MNDTKTGHTPQPWVAIAVDPEKDGKVPAGWGRFQIQTRPDKEHRQSRRAIADVLYKFGTRKAFMEAGADARLISAAPELLEAAKRLDHEMSMDGRVAVSAEAFLLLRAAIAKATGGEE